MATADHCLGGDHTVAAPGGADGDRLKARLSLSARPPARRYLFLDAPSIDFGFSASRWT